MKQSLPSPKDDFEDDLEQLYLRRLALDRVIRSLEDYGQVFAKMPCQAAGQAQGPAGSFERIAS